MKNKIIKVCKTMFDFYLTILSCVVKSRNPAFQSKFNNLVYADDKLSSDEKFYLLGEMQKRWQKAEKKVDKNKEDSGNTKG